MKSLKTTVVLMILFLTVFGSVLYFSQTIIQSKTAVQNTLEEDLSTIVKQVANEVEIKIQSKYDLMRAIGNTALFQNLNVSNDLKQDQLDTVGLADKELIGINIMDLQGNLRVQGAGMLNFCNDPYFTDPIKGKDRVFGPLINTVTNEMTIFYGSPIKDASGKVISTLLIAANGGILCDVCEKIRIGETGRAIIIDRELRTLVGDKNRENVLKGNAVIDEMMNSSAYSGLNTYMEDLFNGNSGGGFFRENGELKLIFYTPVTGTTYSSAVIVEYSEYYKHLAGMRNSIIVVSIIVILIGFFIAIIVGRSLRPLVKLGRAIKDIGSGNADLTQRLELKNTKREIANVVEGFNSFVDKLQGIVASIKNSEDQLEIVDENLQFSMGNTRSDILNINKNLKDVHNQIEVQSSSVKGTSSAVNQIASNIETLEKMIDNQSQGVSQASTAVEEMVGNINSVNTSVEKMVMSFKQLEENTDTGIQTQADVNKRVQQIQEQSKTLQEANKAIASIASQTNLLAMNAAIEAAHAGEAGKGFSVVADEIRKLSETSSVQSKKIGDELKKIQKSIEEVVSASEKSATAFTTVGTSIRTTDEIIHQIKDAMEEQQIGSKQITDALSSMNSSTFEVKAAASEMTEENKQILKEVHNLQVSTKSMQESIDNMSENTNRITTSGKDLSDISNKVAESIEQIKKEINQFKI